MSWSTKLRNAGACAIVLLSACAATTDAERVLTATASAERRIGRSGSEALSSIAALATATSDTMAAGSRTLDAATAALSSSGLVLSDARASLASVTSETVLTIGEARGALGEVAAIVSDARPAARAAGALLEELHGIAADARANVEGGWLSKRLLIGLVVLVAALLVHSIIAHIHLHRRVTKLHRDLKPGNVPHP